MRVGTCSSQRSRLTSNIIICYFDNFVNYLCKFNLKGYFSPKTSSWYRNLSSKTDGNCPFFLKEDKITQGKLKGKIKMKYLKSELNETRNFKNLLVDYVPYPLGFSLKHNLSHTQTLLYAIISHYSKFKYEAFTGSIRTLQVMLNASRSAVETNLKALIERKFIDKKDVNGRAYYKDNVSEKPSKRALYVAYPLSFAVKFNLSHTQTLLYAIIAHYSRSKYKAFTGSLKTLQEYLNCSRGNVNNNLITLIKRGFILKYKDESANVTFVDGLSHKPGETEKELEINALWVSEYGLTREKTGRSARKKGLTKIGTMTTKNKRVGVHFANERTYTTEDLEELIERFDNYKVDDE